VNGCANVCGNAFVFVRRGGGCVGGRRRHHASCRGGRWRCGRGGRRKRGRRR
jgi:hypothetical protein